MDSNSNESNVYYLYHIDICFLQKGTHEELGFSSKTEIVSSVCTTQLDTIKSQILLYCQLVCLPKMLEYQLPAQLSHIFIPFKK